MSDESKGWQLQTEVFIGWINNLENSQRGLKTINACKGCRSKLIFPPRIYPLRATKCKNTYSGMFHTCFLCSYILASMCFQHTYCHGQNKLRLGKIKLIYCELKIELNDEKQRQNLKHLLPGLTSPLWSWLLYLLPASSTAEWGMRGGCSRSTTAFLCQSFLLTLLPNPSCGLSAGCSSSLTSPVWVLQEKTGAAWVPMCYGSFKSFKCFKCIFQALKWIGLRFLLKLAITYIANPTFSSLWRQLLRQPT